MISLLPFIGGNFSKQGILPKINAENKQSFTQNTERNLPVSNPGFYAVYKNVSFGRAVSKTAQPVVDELKKLFNAKKPDEAKIAELFQKLPPGYRENIEGVAQKLKVFGLTFLEYLSSALKFEDLFGQKPDTVEKRVLSAPEAFNIPELKSGMSVEDWIKACKSAPTLFCCTPKEIADKMPEAQKAFEVLGLEMSAEEYFKACKTAPALFARTPKEIADKMPKAREAFKKIAKIKITLKEYLEVCKSAPTLFAGDPKNVAAKAGAYKFVFKFNKIEADKDKLLKQHLTDSLRLTYLKHIVKAIIERQSGLDKKFKWSGLEKQITDYLKLHPEKKYKITIPQDTMSENFIEEMRKFCKEKLGKELDEVFVITVKER